jgi:hypothetical protein
MEFLKHRRGALLALVLAAGSGGVNNAHSLPERRVVVTTVVAIAMPEQRTGKVNAGGGSIWISEVPSAR